MVFSCFPAPDFVWQLPIATTNLYITSRSSLTSSLKVESIISHNRMIDEEELLAAAAGCCCCYTAALLGRRKRHRRLPNSDSGLKLLEMQYTLWIELLFLPTQFLRMKLSLAFQQLLSSTPLLQTQSRVCRRGNWWSPAVHGPSPFEESMLRAKLSAKPGATTGFFFIWGIILSTGSFNGRSPLQAFVGELDWVIRLSSTILMPVISTHFSNK